ncbi:MAG: hypothetical protein OES79_09365 [Planctomycetota bacterium]|nr:hypothetical protein [Planctomycetota bacterium]
MDEPTDSDPAETETGEPEYEVDQAALDDYLAHLHSEQNMFTGFLGGLAGAAIGAVGWALITVGTNTEFGLVAIAVGFLAGYGVRLLGKGMETKFGILGATLAFLGCFAGKLLTIAIIVSREPEGPPFLLALLTMVMNPGAVLEIIQLGFHPMDLLFYGIALYEGYHFAFRRMDESELAQFVRPKAAGEAG